MRRVLCGKLPERDTFAESILSRQTKEDHLGVAVNQPADTVNRRLSDLFLEFMIKGYETDNQGGTAITRPWIFISHGIFYFCYRFIIEEIYREL